jgi:peptide/nickel transport system substrate-binding protein
MMHKSPFNAKWLIFVPLLLLLIIGACGGDDAEAPESGATPSATAVPAPDATATPEPVVSGDPKKGGELRIGMTIADIPQTDLQQDQGWAGQRWVGNQLYNGLTTWNFVGEEGRIPAGMPQPLAAHAESFEVSQDDLRVWTFKIRPNHTFHDGTPVDADAIIFSYDRWGDENFEYYKSEVAAISRGVGGDVIGEYKKLDDMTIQLTTKFPNSNTPFSTAFLKIGSPTAIMKYGNDDFQFNAVGGGPFMMTEITPRVSMVMERFDDYWGKVPNVDRVILRPIPELTTRAAALQADEVDWIDVPPSDAIPGLIDEGFVLYTKPYPHIYPYQINHARKPWDDLRVRKALQYAIDRDALCRDVLNGICIPATGIVYEGHRWYGNPQEVYNYDPEKSRQLLEEAGVELPLKFKLMISTSGSGQMSPLIINEFVQRNFADIGVEMEIVPVEWNAMLQRTIFKGIEEGVPSVTLPDGTKPWGNYTFYDSEEDFDAYNISYANVEPKAFEQQFNSARDPSSLGNVGGYRNEDVDRLLVEAQGAFDDAEMDQLFGQLHEHVIADSAYIYLVHDLNPRMMNPRVRGYVQDESWFTTLQYLWLEE